MFRHPSSYLQFSPGFASCLGSVSSSSPSSVVAGSPIIVSIVMVYMVFSRSSTPISNSVNALEIWLLVCLMMVFMLLLEFLITPKYRHITITIIISPNQATDQQPITSNQIFLPPASLKQTSWDTGRIWLKYTIFAKNPKMQSTNLQDFAQKIMRFTRIFQPNLQSTD